MGRAVLGGLRASEAGQNLVVHVTSRRQHMLNALAEEFDVETTTSNVAAADASDVVLLAVKPQSAEKVLTEPGMADALSGKLLISICAGVTTAQLADWAPGARVLRAMPNTPALVRESMTVIAPGAGADQADIDLASEIFGSVGRVRVLAEHHLDAVTGLSGSGPAFIFVMLEALADGGVMMGLPRDVAMELASQTMLGASRLVLETGAHPASLRDSVTTPAGCTIAGLFVMEDGKTRSTLARTVQEAANVASGLGQGSKK